MAKIAGSRGRAASSTTRVRWISGSGSGSTITAPACWRRIAANAGSKSSARRTSTDSTFTPSRSAAYVDKILKGARPSEIPVEQPVKFDMVINLKTARALGLGLPQSLLIRADQLIQ